MFFSSGTPRASIWGVLKRCRSNGSRDIAVFLKSFVFLPKVKIWLRRPPCICICICMCVFVFAFVYLYLYLCTCICIWSWLPFNFWFIFDENPFLRLTLALHEYLGVLAGGAPFLGQGTSETLSEGIPAQLFDSPWSKICQIGPKRTKKVTLLS